MWQKFEGTDDERMNLIATRIEGKTLDPNPASIREGDQYELDNSEYMNLCNSECFFCGDWTYNFITRLDETKRFKSGNVISECGHCREIRRKRGIATAQEYAAEARKSPENRKK